MQTDEPKSRLDHFEETVIAITLGLMTLITFANVVARYVFNDNILWALESTVFLFAWLVLIGVSYCVKKSMHLGVDIVINMVSPGMKKVLALLSAACCITFALVLLKGSWDYWYPFATKNAWYEVNDIPLAPSLQFLADWFNEGEKYEKIPKFIPYFALPLGMALLTFRFVQAAYRIVMGTQDSLIASHEAEEVEDLLDHKSDDLKAQEGR